MKTTKGEHEDQVPQNKSEKSKPLTFGDFVAGVYTAWGKRKGKGIVQLAIKAHVIEFQGPKRFVFS